jgi:hypothetical protein
MFEPIALFHSVIALGVGIRITGRCFLLKKLAASSDSFTWPD